MTALQNLIFILSDNHNHAVMGCAGHPIAHTPNLDRLAAQGTRFENAYCASPLCCPARASLATGLYPHQTGYWDNAIVYDGRIESWMHRLRDAGHTVVSIGKLHFRSTDDDNGFGDEIEPMHILDGRGGVRMLLRGYDAEPQAIGQWELYTEQSGVGDTPYQAYDRKITHLAVNWLRDHAARIKDKPWALFVGYVSPHPPFQVPQRLFDLYPLQQIPLPSTSRSTHPSDLHLRHIMGTKELSDPDILRRVAAGYFGLITHLDEQIGEVLATVDDLGLSNDTRFVYTSDHGELFGAHGLFGKSNMYEGALRVPMILAGPGVRRNETVAQVVSHVDLFPTVIEAVAGHTAELPAEARGASLWPAIAGDKVERTGFAEYHATGTRSGIFMLRQGVMKLLYHLDRPPQLFDLGDDPDECHDLAPRADQRHRLETLETELRRVCDPEDVSERAKRDQRNKVIALGGRASIEREGALVFTPPPGARAELRK